MKTKYFRCIPILKEALCDNCGTILRFVRSDLSRDTFCWLHACDGCGKAYWLDNRFPYADYLFDTNQPMDIATDPISCKEAK